MSRGRAGAPGLPGGLCRAEHLHRAGRALTAAVEAQRTLAAEPWPGGTSVRVRMAIHAGEVAEVGDELFGMALHQVSRMLAVTHGGQIVVSDAAVGLIAQPAPDISLLDLGVHRLRALHLENGLRTGVFCSYAPERPVTWRL